MRRSRFKKFSIEVLHGLAFMALWVMVLAITGCDTPSQFQGLHPKEAIVIEDVLEFMEKVAEKEAESVIHLPDGSLHVVFDHKLFVVPAATVDAALAAGVTLPVAK